MKAAQAAAQVQSKIASLDSHPETRRAPQEE